jgi:hypothetical protein
MKKSLYKKLDRTQLGTAVLTAGVLGYVVACSGAKPTDHSFYIKPTTQTFGTTQTTTTTKQVDQTNTRVVNRPVDLLWVVDNSASMEVSQDKLRKAFSGFSQKYMTASLDIRTAVITTDLYMANTAFSDYWNSTIPGTATTQNQIHPKWNADYAKLLPGIHDGPIPALCDKNIMGDFYLGPSKCEIRDAATANKGPADCLTPAAGETQITQCVNTVNNDSIHSGQPILSTIPPTGTSAADWQKQITQNFLINMSVGTSGSGEEKGLGSFTQFLADNEAPASTSHFFRPGSLRVIIFLSDEDDQSQAIPNSSPNTPMLKENSDYDYTSCPTKTVDGYSYALTYCVEPSSLIPVSQIKSTADAFFNQLDGITTNTANPNYIIAAVVAQKGTTVRTLQNLQKTMQRQSGLRVTTDQDQGSRYIQFEQLVGNGSQVIDIGAEDYTSVLQNIGQTIVTHNPQSVPVTTYAPISTFELDHPVNTSSTIVISIQRANGTIEDLSSDQYTVEGTTVTLTDESVIQSLASGDHLQVMYRPNGAYES